jgi:AsmA protein
MRRILKILGYTIGTIVVLLIVVIVGVLIFVDPNDYKDRITAAVNEATGRTLTLEGDLSLTIIPLGISLGAAELSNAEGFGEEPFASIESARLSVGLLPLLSRRVKVGTANLTGLRLNLERNASGVTNWDDLAREGPAAEAPAPEAEAAEGGSVDISVGKVEIADAEVSWQDALAGQDWRLSDFNLTAEDFNPGEAFPLSIGFHLEGAEVAVTVDSSMRALVSLADSTYRLDELAVEITGEGANWPGGSGEASLGFESFVANLETQQLQLINLELAMLGLNVSGNLVGEDVMDNLSLEGRIDIGDFDPRYVMGVFDQSIDTADPDVLKLASASAEFYYDANRMGLREMVLRLDDSTLTGAAGQNGERFEFDLDVDRINIDRYLPPPAAGTDEAVAADTGSVDEVDLPIQPLRNFNARGNLGLGEAQFLGMTFTEANFALVAGNGRMTLTPTGRLYGGTTEGEIVIEVQGDAARLSLRENLNNIDMMGLARDYLKMETLEGTGTVSLNLAAVGRKVGDIKQDLDGTASVAITDGAWLGIDVWHAVTSARAKLTGPEVAPLTDAPRTTFSRVAIGGNVNNAVLSTNEFVGVLPFAALSGTGTVHLLTTELDIRARAGLVDGPVLQQDPVFARLAGVQFPLRVTGTLDAPSILPDLSELGSMVGQAVRAEAEAEVDEAVEETREEVNQELEQEREEAEERLEDSLRDRLRDLD